LKLAENFINSIIAPACTGRDLLPSFSVSGRDSNATDMGKKGSWFSAIKRVFTHHSKGKVSNINEMLD